MDEHVDPENVLAQSMESIQDAISGALGRIPQQVNTVGNSLELVRQAAASSESTVRTAILSLELLASESLELCAWLLHAGGDHGGARDIVRAARALQETTSSFMDRTRV
jgi:hypothetical protein